MGHGCPSIRTAVTRPVTAASACTKYVSDACWSCHCAAWCGSALAADCTLRCRVRLAAIVTFDAGLGEVRPALYTIQQQLICERPSTCTQGGQQWKAQVGPRRQACVHTRIHAARPASTPGIPACFDKSSCGVARVRGCEAATTITLSQTFATLIAARSSRSAEHALHPVHSLWTAQRVASQRTASNGERGACLLGTNLSRGAVYSSNAACCMLPVSATAVECEDDI